MDETGEEERLLISRHSRSMKASLSMKGHADGGEGCTQIADAEDHKKLGEFAATAICGNDITASCFYVVGELSKNAGVYSPCCTLLSSFTLYCFRHVYGEVVSMLPLNGGIYNLLLNSSTKQVASVAACLSILSYTATGVVSSVSAVDYLRASPLLAGIDVVPAAVGILAFFAVLMLLGMKESSVVASGLFMFHLSVLFVLVCFSLVHLQYAGFDQLHMNLAWPKQPPPASAIFFGFSSAMLGVSGFETSANFVEEQKPGVFPKTLTNMWISVSVINVMLPSLAIMVLPMNALSGVDSSFAVAFLAERVGGEILRDVVVVDALLVLAGSVLTSYVGVVGLFQRMAGDGCLPAFFGYKNEWRGTTHWTILIFFAVCSSMCVLLDGNITLLAAVYSISFLLVMALFAICGLWMKVKCPDLPRVINAPPKFFVLGLALVACAFVAVIILHESVLVYFYMYYGITCAVVLSSFAGGTSEDLDFTSPTQGPVGLSLQGSAPGSVYVQAVASGSWAERSGVSVGDEIRFVNGIAISELAQASFDEEMQTRPLRFTVRRKASGVALKKALTVPHIEMQDLLALGPGGLVGNVAWRAWKARSKVKDDSDGL